MKIVGFGDSFITSSNHDYVYTNTVAKHFNAEFKSYANAGSGAWDAFFELLDRKEECDVLMFVWSAEHRFYHPDYRNICPAGIERNLRSDPVWEAAKQYYAYLYDCRKTYFEHVALYDHVDKYLQDNYPDTKVIHLWGFPAANPHTVHGELIKPKQYDWGEPEKFSYLYRFKHGVEIRPALIHLSYLDGWSGSTANETRTHHMTPAMHSRLSKYVIDAIENYSLGRLIDYSDNT